MSKTSKCLQKYKNIFRTVEVCIIIEIIMYVGKTLPMVSSVVVSAAVLEYKNGQIRILCQRKT